MLLHHNLNDYFIILITTVITLNGISVPMSYNIIADKLGPYLDNNIYDYFINEEKVKNNLITSIYSFIYFLIPLFFNFEIPEQKEYVFTLFDYLKIVYFIVSIFFISGFIICFFQFSSLIYQYAFNTEKMLFEKLKNKIDQYV